MSERLRILILGAGATGGYFGARMAAAGVDVTFLVRERRAAQIAANGLVVRSPVGDLTLSAKTVTHASGDYDVVLLTCKAYDLDSAVEAIAPAVGPTTSVLPLLNGLRHYDVLDDRFGKPRVLGGLCHIGVTMTDDGEIRHLSAPAHLALGARLPEQTERCAALHAELASGGFKPVLSANVSQDIWEKFAFIAAYAGLTCSMRASIGAIAAADDGFPIANKFFDECAAIAAAAGYPLREAFITASRLTMTERGSKATSSMLRDVLRGARTEHDHILGDMLQRAVAADLDTPLLRVARTHLQAYEASRAAQ